MTYTANVDGNTDIYLYDVATGKVRALPLPKGLNDTATASAFSHDNARCSTTTTVQRARRPLDLHAGRWQVPPDHELLIGGVAPRHGQPYLVHYPSKDGKWTISAFV